MMAIYNGGNRAGHGGGWLLGDSHASVAFAITTIP